MNLTKEDLKRIKNEVNNASDDELYAEMEKRWLEGKIDESAAPPERISALFRNIRKEIRGHLRISRALRWVGIAAAVLIPLSLLTIVFKYKETKRQATQELAIVTARGEQSSITLPDGTKVKLNELSELRYSPGRFGTKKRELDFKGERYFEVARKEDCPFVVNADQMSVTVLGTVFDLSARPEDSFDKLYLIDGSVCLKSSKTGEELILNPSEEAILDKASGKLTVSKAPVPEKTTSWVRKEITLKKVSLSELLDILSDKYEVTFSVDKRIDKDELFTGTLPADNLLVCSEIIEYTFGVKVKILDGKVLITK